MSRTEIMNTRFGEMRDFITCYQIEKGDLVPKSKKHKLSYQEAISLE